MKGWRHNAGYGAILALTLRTMPSVQIKNVPPEVHRVLRRRAVEAGQSLQEYLLELLAEQALQPTLDEVLRRSGDRAGGDVPLADAVEAVRMDRAER
jgi:antitoxin FitA